MPDVRHATWRTLSRRRLLDASPWLRVWRERVELPDGRVVDDYHIVELPDFAVVAAFTRDGRLVAERHYRHGVRRVVLGLPAGLVEPGEDPMAAARRELLEETGYGAGTWRSLGSFALSDSRLPGRAHLFLADEVELLAEPSDGDLEETEVLLIPEDRFLQAIEDGEVADVVAVGTLLLARSARELMANAPDPKKKRPAKW